MTPRSITLTLPLPYRELSPNGRVHWAKKAKWVGIYRHECAVQARAEVGPGFEPFTRARLELVVCVKGSRRIGRLSSWDPTNASAAFKAGLDGLVDAGILVADDTKHLIDGGTTIDRDRGPYIEATITAIA